MTCRLISASPLWMMSLDVWTMHSCKARHSRKPRPPSKEMASTSLTHTPHALKSPSSALFAPILPRASSLLLPVTFQATQNQYCVVATPPVIILPPSLSPFLDQKHPSPFRAPTLGSLPFTSHNFFSPIPTLQLPFPHSLSSAMYKPHTKNPTNTAYTTLVCQISDE